MKSIEIQNNDNKEERYVKEQFFTEIQEMEKLKDYNKANQKRMKALEEYN